MMRKLALLLLFTLLSAPASFVWAESGVLVDAQLVETGEKQYLLKLRSTQPQAFDVERSDDSVRVKLYQVEMGDLSSLGSTPFGFAVFSRESDKDSLLTLMVSDPHYRVSVQQGGSAETVDVRVVWEPDITGPVISEVKAEEVSSSSAAIIWTTDEVSDSQVAYGKTQPEGELSSLVSEKVTAHRVELTNLTPGQQYSFRVRSKDAAGNLTVSEASIFNTTVPAFKESGGVVVMEAENFDDKIARSGKIWTVQTGGKKGDYSGTSYLSALSNSGVTIKSQVTVTSPELKYSIDFKTPGTYYIWLRGKAPTSADGSVNAGINGVNPTSADRITSFISSWRWRSTKFGNTRPTIKVTKAGVHTFHLWMREDGFQIDKILLRTSNSTVAPDNLGPAESPRTA